MMSDTGVQVTARARRPKRLLSKTSDDNVLGISWKEERELRRAIYVSLRDQHNPAPLGRAWVMSKLRARGSSHMIRANNAARAITTGTYLLRRSGLGRSSCPGSCATTTVETIGTNATGSTLRRAKLRATARLNGIVSPPRRPTSPNCGNSSTSTSNGRSGKTNRHIDRVSANTAVRLQMRRETSVKPTTASSHLATNTSSTEPGSPRRQTLWRLKKSVWTVNPDAQSVRVRGNSRRPSLMMNASNGIKPGNRASGSTHTSRNKGLDTPEKKLIVRRTANNRTGATAAGSSTATGASRKRPNVTTSGHRSRPNASRVPSASSIKSRLAKKLVSTATATAAATAKSTSALSRTNRATKVSEKAPASIETVPSRPGARPDRKLSFNGDNPGDLAPPVIKRPPPLVPAELCQDPNGQPVSVHDFIEFVCYHGTPCLSPRLAWFSEPRTTLTCSTTHGSCTTMNNNTGTVINVSPKSGEANSPNGFVPRACIATATPTKRGSKPSPKTSVAHLSGCSDPISLKVDEEDVLQRVSQTLTTPTTKSPKVFVAKKMASVHQVPSFQVPQPDLFSVLSRTEPNQIDCLSQPQVNSPAKPSSAPMVGTALWSNKDGVSKQSSRRMSKNPSRATRGQSVRK